MFRGIFRRMLLLPSGDDAQQQDVQRLKYITEMSSLLAGFAFTSLCQVSIEKELPLWLVLAFALQTSLVICVYLFAQLVAMSIVPNLEAYRSLIRLQRPGSNVPYKRLRVYLHVAWLFATGVGVLVFLADVILVAWTQFYFSSRAAYLSVTAFLAPWMLLFVIYTYRIHNKIVGLQLELADLEGEPLRLHQV